MSNSPNYWERLTSKSESEDDYSTMFEGSSCSSIEDIQVRKLPDELAAVARKKDDADALKIQVRKLPCG